MFPFQTNDDKSSEFVVDAGRDSALSDYIATHMVPLPNLSTMATESEEDGKPQIYVAFLLSSSY